MSKTSATKTFGRAELLIVIGIFLALTVDGMDLQMLSLALPVLMTDLNLTKVMAGSLGTWTLAGMAIGGIIAGWLADRYGRVRVTFWSVVVFSAFTATLAFTHSYWQFAIIRFCSGFGLAALYSVGTLTAAEYVPTERRTTILGILQAGWSVGYIVAALLSSYLLPNFGWRPMFLFAIVPGALTLWVLYGLEEPPSWHAARQDRLEGRVKGNEFVKLWNDRGSRKTFLLWTITAIALQFGYYGANNWLPSYLVKDLGVNLKSMGWYIAGTYTMMVLGKVITGWLADIFGRRLLWVLAGVFTAVALPLIMSFATPASVAYLLLIFGFLYGAPYAINSTYLSESFPTHVRGTAVATSYNIGRIGSTISPLLIGLAATKYSIAFGIGLLGIAYAVCGLIPGLFIREKMYDPKAVVVQEQKNISA